MQQFIHLIANIIIPITKNTRTIIHKDISIVNIIACSRKNSLELLKLILIISGIYVAIMLIKYMVQVKSKNLRFFLNDYNF